MAGGYFLGHAGRPRPAAIKMNLFIAEFFKYNKKETSMGFTLETGVSAAAVFLQGILSFFSPCVLPLVPLYIGYLAGGAKSVDADGTVRYKRGPV